MVTTTFTSSGTWTCPAGVTSVDYVIVGGGGRGGNGNNSTYPYNAAGQGGGAGSVLTGSASTSPGTVYTITVGVSQNASVALGQTAAAGTSGGLQGAPTYDGQDGAAGYSTGTSASNGGDASCGGGVGGTGGTGYGAGGGGGASLNFGCSSGAGGAGGAGATGIVKITYSLPVVAFNGVGTGSSDPPAGAKPMSVTWTNSTTGATSYAWSFPGANVTSSTSTTPSSSTYATSGNYDVTLTAYNAYGYSTLVKAGYVTVYGIPYTQAIIIAADHHRGR